MFWLVFTSHQLAAQELSDRRFRDGLDEDIASRPLEIGEARAAAEKIEILGRDGRARGLVEDWLRHAGADTDHELAQFFNGPGNGRLAATGLIDLLGWHAATLQRRLKQVSR